MINNVSFEVTQFRTNGRDNAFELNIFQHFKQDQEKNFIRSIYFNCIRDLLGYAKDIQTYGLEGVTYTLTELLEDQSIVFRLEGNKL